MNKHEDYEKHTHLHEHNHYHAYNCVHLDLQEEAAEGSASESVKKLQAAHEYNQVTIKVSRKITVVNLFLAVLKLLAGLIGNSSALVADSMHAFSDVFGSFAIFVGAKIADKPKNRGKKGLSSRIEGTISLILSAVLLITGAEIAIDALTAIISGSYAELELPTILPLIVAICAIVIKEIVYFYSNKYAKQINSVGLKAMAWHNQTDALISLGSFVGILGSRLGYSICDPLASLIICILVLRAAAEIFIEAIRALRGVER